MIRFLVFIILFQGILFGCTICTVSSPKMDISINIKADKKNIKTAKIKWTFSKSFTLELLELYDRNFDGIFSKEELEPIEDSLLVYIEPRNYLTFISYDKQINANSNQINVKNYKLAYKNSSLYFEYTLDLNYEIFDKNRLFIKIYDEESYFIMIFDEKKQLLSIPYKIKKEVQTHNVTFTIDAPSLKNTNINEKNRIIENEIIKETIETKIENEDTFLVEKELGLLEKFVKKIKQYLLDIEKGEDKLALLFLLLASFIYGIIHALGPGHGKALAFSYFSAQKSSYTQAFVISFLTAFIHILGALILVIISIFILQSVFSSFLDDWISYITSVSAVLIMLLSLYILYRKLKKKSCVCSACSMLEQNKPMFSTEKKDISFIRTSKNEIHFDKNRKKQDLYFVLTAGLIPCPGTVVLFVYAFILKTYFSVFLASIAISLGMGLVIFLSSFLGVSLNKVSNKSIKFTNFLEILAPIFMFILGLFLLLNADIL
ncbi:DUF1007 family protein [Poseidonibacter sp.]|uniref:HoxN/HupN/NixA family nickel/cobalt transporter n=1 Tax=Poseidonibacter sp. TaxID=2321188 RepID=UPI0035A18B8F